MSEPEFVLVSAEEQRRAEQLELPSSLPILPLKETVVLPGTMTPLAIGQPRSLELIEDVVAGDRLLALVMVRDEGSYEIGTGAFVHRMMRVSDGTVRVVVHGLRRVAVTRRISEEPYLVGDIAVVPDRVVDADGLAALSRAARELFERVAAVAPYLPPELQVAAATVDDPSTLCHLIASTVRLEPVQRQRLLETDDVAQRLHDVLLLLDHELEFAV